MKPGTRKTLIALACTFLALNALAGTGFAAQDTNPTYLPLLSKAQAGGPGPNPGNDFTNPGFEDGLSGWDFVSGAGGSDIPSEEKQHSGKFSAKLGGENNWGASVAQSVTVPSDRPVLEYWTWILSDEGDCGEAYDFFTVSVNSGEITRQGLCTDISTETWERRTLDLSAYAGQEVLLKIRFESDNVLKSEFFLDDVGFVSAN